MFTNCNVESERKFSISTFDSLFERRFFIFSKIPKCQYRFRLYIVVKLRQSFGSTSKKYHLKFDLLNQLKQIRSTTQDILYCDSSLNIF